MYNNKMEEIVLNDLREKGVLIDRFMVDHSGDFGGGSYSIHRDFANCIATTIGSNDGHMVFEIYERSED